MAQFAPIQTSPTMVWTKYPNFQVPPDPPLATNRPRAAPTVSVPGCSGVPDLRKIPALELAKSIRAMRGPARPAMGAVQVQTISPNVAMAQAVGQVVGGVVSIVLNGVMGYYVGKWAGASKGWTAVGTAVLGPLGTFASVGLTGGRKKCATPNCSCKPRHVKANSKPYRSAKTWDLLWENYIAARRSGDKKRILDTAELLEIFDRSTGFEPTVTVRRVKKEFGWK